jgi:hypothetical protein
MKRVTSKPLTQIFSDEFWQKMEATQSANFTWTPLALHLLTAASTRASATMRDLVNWFWSKVAALFPRWLMATRRVWPAYPYQS